MTTTIHPKSKQLDAEAPEWATQAHANIRILAGGAILAGAAALTTVLQGLIGAFSGTGDRSAAIGIDNFSGQDLSAPETYIYSGQVVAPPSPLIPAGGTGDCAFVKTSGTARGTTGIASWNIGKLPFKLVVFWSNPYDYVSASQLIYLEVVSTDVSTDYNLYHELWSKSVPSSNALSGGFGLNFNGTDTNLKWGLNSGTTAEMIMRASLR